MTATTDIHWEAVKRLVFLIREELPDTQVSTHWQGDETDSEAIWVAGTESTDITIPVMGAAREIRDDTFDITLRIGCFGEDMDDVQDRCHTFISAIEDVCAANSELAVDNVALPGILWAKVTEKRRSPWEVQEGGVAVFAEVVVEVRSRLI